MTGVPERWQTPLPRAHGVGPAAAGSSRLILHEWLFGLASLGLLVLSSASSGTPGDIGRLLWLASVAGLCLANIGAAVAVYFAAASLYSAKVSAGWSTIYDRPDNFALLIIFFSLVVLRPGNVFAKFFDRVGMLTLAFLAYFLVQTAALGAFDRVTIAWFMRTAGFPFMLFVLIRRSGLVERELHALFRGVAVLGVYTAVVSLCEQLDLHWLVLPPWINDPYVNQTYYDPRAGGLLMQSEWNGLALGLMLCVMFLPPTMYPVRLPFARLSARLMTALALFFTYTRGAWLGSLVSTLVLFRRPRNPALAYLRMIGFGVVSVGIVFQLLTGDSVARGRLSDVNTIYYRLALWQAGIRIATDHPWLGIGFAKFAESSAHYQADSGLLGENAPALAVADAAHNTVLSFLVELGVIGLVLYLLLFVAQVRAALAAAGRHWGSEGRRWVLAFTVVYVVNVQFVVAHEVTTNVLYFGILGAIASRGLAAQRARPA